MNRLSAIALGLLFAFPAMGADLLQVYRDARAQDPVLLSARAQVDATRERVPQAQAGLKPQVGLGATLSGDRTDPQSFPATTKAGGGYTLQLTIPLYRPQAGLTIDQTKRGLTQAEYQYSAAEHDLIIRVAQAYFDVLLSQDNVDVSGAQKKAIAEQLAQAKRSFEVGTATITDTNEAQARFDQATAREIADQNELELKREGLRLLVAKLPPTLAKLRENITLPAPSPANMKAWENASVEKNPRVLFSQAQTDIAQLEISKARAANRPTLDLIATQNHAINGSTSPLTGERLDVQSQQIGVQLNYPLYTGGANSARIRETSSLYERALQDLENSRREVTRNTLSAYLGVTSGIAQVAALEQALRSSQVSLDSTRLGRDVGVRTSLDVLNAQQQVFQARRDLFSARYSVILNQLRLKQSAGQLGETDLQEVNALLVK